MRCEGTKVGRQGVLEKCAWFRRSHFIRMLPHVFSDVFFR